MPTSIFRLRLLPVTLFAVSLMLTVKIGSIWHGVDGVFDGSVMAADTQTNTSSQSMPAPTEEPPVNESQSNGDPVAETDPAEGQPENKLSDSEIELLQRLAERRETLEERSRAAEKQQALLKAFTRLKTFEHRSEGSFRHWLARLVQVEIVACARRGGAKKRGGGRVRRFRDYPSQSLSESFFRAPGPSPSSVVEAREREQQIEAALLGMPQHHREVIILRQFCGLSYKEIAEAMGFRQEETARKAWYRALQKLKKSLSA